MPGRRHGGRLRLHKFALCDFRLIAVNCDELAAWAIYDIGGELS